MLQLLVLVLVILVALHCQYHNVEGLSSSSPQSSSTNKLLILGLGRVGRQVAELALSRFNGQVVGTVRQLGSQQDSDDGITRILFEPTAVRNQLLVEDVSQQPTHVLLTIPLTKERDPTFDTILDHVKEWWKTPSQLLGGQQQQQQQSGKWIGILSTTGVYGNHDGEWVTEDSPLLCQVGSNADLYRKFEEDWIQFAVDQKSSSSLSSSSSTPNHRLCIFRCAGIYDSSRSALHTVYNKGIFGRPTSSSQSPLPDMTPEKSGKTNRIHSLDLSRAVLSSMLPEHRTNNNNQNDKTQVVVEPPTAVRIYNLADNLPENRDVVLSYAKELLSGIAATVPSSSSVEMKRSDDTIYYDTIYPSRSSAGRQNRRQQEQKLVSNYRMRNELLPEDGNSNQENTTKLESRRSGLLFPTYKEGLRNIFEDPSTPWRNIS